MRRLFLTAALLAMGARPPPRPEWIICGNAEGTVSIGVLAGSFEFLNISAATLDIGDERWSSGEPYGPGEPVRVAQAYRGDNQLVVDLSDDNAEVILAELRVYIAGEGADYVQGGVLRSPGRGAWVVGCEGP